MGMLSSIGGMAGGVIGGMFGPIGSAIGQKLGSGLGGMLENMMSKSGSQNAQSGLSNSSNNQATSMAHQHVDQAGLPKFICDKLHEFIDSQASKCQMQTPPDCQSTSNMIFSMFAQTSVR